MTISTIGNGTAQPPIAQAGQGIADIQRPPGGSGRNGRVDGAALLQLDDLSSARIQGINRSLLQTNDAIATTQIAEAGLHAVQADLLRLRDLSIQAMNTTLSAPDRQNLQLTADQIQQNITATIADTRYGGTTLLNAPVLFQSAPGAGAPSVIPPPDLAAVAAPLRLATPAGAQNAVLSLNETIRTVDDAQLRIQTARADVTARAASLFAPVRETVASVSPIAASDLAAAATLAVSAAIRAQPALAIQTQANQSPLQVQTLL